MERVVDIAMCDVVVRGGKLVKCLYLSVSFVEWFLL